MSLLANELEFGIGFQILGEMAQVCGVYTKFQFWSNMEFGLN